MNEFSEKMAEYRAFLTAGKQRLEEQIRRLEQENRQDEADLMKIRLNIYGVFETVAAADEKVTEGWEAFCRRYEPRFAALSAPWQARLEAAVKNSDTRTRYVEEIKLGTADHIRNAFQAIKEKNR